MIRAVWVLIACVGLLLLDPAQSSAERRRRRKKKPPASKPKPKQEGAEARLEKGRSLKQAGAYTEALAEFEAAYAITPDPEILIEIAECRRLNKERDASAETYRRYLEAAPKGPLAARAQTALDEIAAEVKAEEEAAAKAKAEEETAAKAKAEEEARRAEAERAKAAAASQPAAPAPGTPGQVAYDHATGAGLAITRTTTPPRIDGVLDDAIWKTVPPDSRFYWEESKPYGLPSPAPTSVQVAYDSDAVYVAFRCGYATPEHVEDAAPLDQEADFPEYVAVYVDPEHDHANARTFALSPRGYRAEWESWRNGFAASFEWSAIWEGRTRQDANGWTAEFAIPWGSVGLRGQDGPFRLGLNFRRNVPPATVVWALSPPGSPRPLPSFFGHLDAKGPVRPGQIITLVPYAAVGYSPGVPFYRQDFDRGRLRDLDGDATPLEPYGGLYGRLQLSALRLDFTVNPDFSQVTPDAAVARLDRFELFFPEVRDFFVESAKTFGFGLTSFRPEEAQRFQLFYSRRIGLRRRRLAFDEVPLLYGANAVFRKGGTTAAVLDVYNERLPGPIEFGNDTTVRPSHVTVARVQQQEGSTRLGAIFLNQTQSYSPSAYRAYGADGTLSLYQDHFILSGFVARSDKLILWDVAGAAEPTATRKDYKRFSDEAWMLFGGWRSQEFEASVSYLDVGEDFHADLGFFERTNAKRSEAVAIYRPQVQSDLLRAVGVGGLLTRLVTRSDAVITEKLTARFETVLTDRATIRLDLTRATDNVQGLFFVAGQRLGISPGEYVGTVTNLQVRSAPHRSLELAASYLDGAFFDGQQRIITPEVVVRRGPLAAAAIYQYFYLRPGPSAVFPDAVERDRLQGHRVSGRLLWAPTPDLKLSAAIELNTLDPTATTQAVVSWRLRALTNLILVANRSGPGEAAWREAPAQQVLLKLTYGLAVP